MKLATPMLAAVAAFTASKAPHNSCHRLIACSEGARADTTGIRAPSQIRVVLASAPREIAIGGAGSWKLEDARGRVHARSSQGAAWRVERDGRRLRGVSSAGRTQTAWSEERFVVLPDAGEDVVTWNGRRYRGALHYLATDTAVLVVNVLPIETYLRGVVPLEIGPRPAAERSAVEAQAIAARSYTVVRALEGVTRTWDLTARATDQVYGGVEAERATSDEAIRATSGVVLAWRGQVVRAPYHSTCGGSTAAPSEVFRGGRDEYLRSVPDRIPGSSKTWCEISPRFRWERRFDSRALARLVSSRAGRAVSPVRGARVRGLTTSGRVQSMVFDTDAGPVSLAGNDLRFALTGPGGDILPSTDFEATWDRDGSGLTLQGRGNGHGVGMCQWGAIGRSRAGMDAASILLAYFPGTELARLRQSSP